MRVFVFCAVLVLVVPGFGSAQENPKDREMCLYILPWVGRLRAELVGPLDFDNLMDAGLHVVAHTRRKEALNCVFMYERPTPTYVHVLYQFATKRIMVVRLASVDAGIINMTPPKIPD